MYLVVRTSSGRNITAAVRAILVGLDATAALYDVAPMEQRVAGSLYLRRSRCC